MDQLPRAPVVIPELLEDPGLVRRLVAANGPYWPVQRYMANTAEYAALSGNPEAAQVVAPVFRGDWAVDGSCLAPVEELLHLPAFCDGARRLFSAEIVRPQTIYVNLTWQLPFAQGAGHTDIPAFRGVDRSEHPVAFLTLMGASGLFEQERVKVATAVAWFYEGADGGFEYWPDGPDAPSVVHEGAIDNTAVVGDNDFMWHRVRATGRPEDGMVTLDLDSELRRDDEGSWRIVSQDRTVAELSFEQLRISLSWKAVVFDSEADRRRHDEHTDDLTLDEVVERFRADICARGVEVAVPEDPERDPDFLRLLTSQYLRYPTTPAA
jgi:hypothetical protein